MNNEIVVRMVIWIYNGKYGIFHLQDISEMEGICQQMMAEDMGYV